MEDPPTPVHVIPHTHHVSPHAHTSPTHHITGGDVMHAVDGVAAAMCQLEVSLEQSLHPTTNSFGM